MRISPLVTNPPEALSEARHAVYSGLGLEQSATGHGDGSSSDCGCELCGSLASPNDDNALVLAAARTFGTDISHDDGCACGACAATAKTTQSDSLAPHEEVMSSSGLSLSNPLQSLHWGTKLDLTNKVVNVHFVPAGSPGYLPTGAGTVAWNAYEMAQAKLALETFSDALDITIEYTSSINEAEFVLHLLDGNASGVLMNGALGMMFPPGEGFEGYGFFNRDGFGWSSSAGGGLDQGGYGFITLIHEFGHGFGLAHPHDTGGSSSILPGVSNNQDPGQFDLNQGVFTTMSYYDGWPVEKGTSYSASFGWQSTPMNLDRAMLQQLYGTGENNQGETTFVLPAGASAGVDFQAIWDSSGVDEIVNSTGLTSTIDLREASITQAANGAGYVSHIGTIYGGFTLPATVEIENATGGTAADTIYGNDLDNIIDGSGGNDDIHHGGGSNIYIGGGGNDHVYFTLPYGSYSFTTVDGALTVDDGRGASSIDSSIENLVFNGQTYSYATVLSSLPGNSEPLFSSGTTVSFAENGIGVVYTAGATDSDDDVLTYDISGGADGADFSIDSAGGQLMFISPPDFEASASEDNDNDYEVEIRVRDGNGGTATQTLTVRVTDVSEGTVPTEVIHDGVTYELITSDALSFGDAEAFARAKGGYLAVLTDPAEADTVFGMVDTWFQANASAYAVSSASDGGSASYVWVGAGDFSREGIWKWSNDNLLDATYANWGGSDPGEPTGRAQDALGMALQPWPYENPPYSGAAGEWNDIRDSNLLYFVVEYGDDQVLETNGSVEPHSIPWLGYEVQGSSGDPIELTDRRGTLISKRTTLTQAENDGETGFLALEQSATRRGEVRYSVHQFDSEGAAVGRPKSLGTSDALLVDWEDDFGIDLNGDGDIGHTLHEIESAGDVTLSSSTSGGYAINHDGGGDIDLTDRRGKVIQQSSRFDFEHAEASNNGGYDVLVNMPRRGVENYRVRHFDSSGEEVGRATSIGTSEPRLVDWEDDFEIDLNGDGDIGHTLNQIESVGDVTLSSSTSGGFTINHGGLDDLELVDLRGPAIKQSKRYEFVHAEDNSSGGYDVLVNSPRRGDDSYKVRHFDSNGQEVGRATSIRTSEPLLVDWEDDFEVDLNADTNIGHLLTEIERDGDVILSSSTSGGYSINHDGEGDLDLVDRRGRVIQQSSRYDFEHVEETTSGGYDALVNSPRRGVDHYKVRHFDSNGEEVGRSTFIGNSESALIAWEDIFEADLNDDSAIGRFQSGSLDVELI